MRTLSILLIGLLAVFAANVDASAATLDRPLFRISVRDDALTVSILSDSTPTTGSGRIDQIEHRGDTVFVGESVRFEKETLRVGDQAVPYDLIFDAVIERNTSKEKIVTFMTCGSTTLGASRLRGNIISFDQPVSVDSGVFVRGAVFTIAAKVSVHGEVNRSVIALFQDISLKRGSVVRGNLISLTGELRIDRSSSVYGEHVSISVSRKGSRRYELGFSDRFSLGPRFVYNRVDGATVWAYAEFHDPDSTLPGLKVEGGYAFASKRLRLHAQVTQVLSRKMPSAISAEFYRGLRTVSRFSLEEKENTFTALLAREDFHEYYESIGGGAQAIVHPNKRLNLRAGYRYEETNWLSSHANLWSLFGGEKRFPKNFRHVDSVRLADGMQQIDTSVNGMISLGASYTTRKEGWGLFEKSVWELDGTVEWSLSSIGSDFEYSKYQVRLMRFQKLHERGFALARIIYGGRGGTLPLHKLFYVGGLNTLRGYRQDRFFGDYLLIGSLEYRVDIPKTMLGLGVFYDGALMVDRSLTPDLSISDSPSLNDVGLTLYLFRETGILSLGWPTGKKPDGSDPIFYGRINFGF